MFQKFDYAGKGAISSRLHVPNIWLYWERCNQQQATCSKNLDILEKVQSAVGYKFQTFGHNGKGAVSSRLHVPDIQTHWERCNQKHVTCSRAECLDFVSRQRGRWVGKRLKFTTKRSKKGRVQKLTILIHFYSHSKAKQPGRKGCHSPPPAAGLRMTGVIPLLRYMPLWRRQIKVYLFILIRDIIQRITKKVGIVSQFT